MIGDLDGIHFDDRDGREIFLHSADKLYLLVYITIEIDGGAFESDLFAGRVHDRMGVIGEFVVHGDLSGKGEGGTQSEHILLRRTSISLSDAVDQFDQKEYSEAYQEKSEEYFRTYYFFLSQLPYNHIVTYIV